jgi:ATP-dependent 26S proteasome regulatory subunit
LDTRTEEEQKARDHDAALTTKEDGGGEGDVADSNAVADGTYKSRLAGTTFRQRKRLAQTTSIPKPPPVPDWFLEHNVKLFVDTVNPTREAENAWVLRCVDRATGHTLFTLPYHELRGRPAEAPAESTGRPSTMKPTAEAPAESTDCPSTTKPTAEAPAENTDCPSTTKPAAEAPAESTGRPSTTKPTVEAPAEGSSTLVDPFDPPEILRWAMLQAETGVRAAFSVARNPPSAASRAASRLDLSLFCKDPNSHASMDDFVEDLAILSDSNVIRLDANDLADLSADYVGQGSDSPGSFSNLAYDVFGGHTSHTATSALQIGEDHAKPFDEHGMEEDEEQKEEEEEERRNHSGGHNITRQTLDSIRTTIMRGRFEFAEVLDRIGPQDIIVDMDPRWSRPPRSSGSSKSGGEQQYDENRLASLLEHILDAPQQSRGSSTQPRYNLHAAETDKSGDIASSDASHQALRRLWRTNVASWRPDVAIMIASRIVMAHRSPMGLEESRTESVNLSAKESTERTIVHVRDLRDIAGSRVGDAIVRRLVSVVQKRRRAGQQIVIVGSSCYQPSSFVALPKALNEFITVRVPAVSRRDRCFYSATSTSDQFAAPYFSAPPSSRIWEVNLRHIQRMLKSLRPGHTIDMFTESAQHQLVFGEDPLSKKVLSFDRIQGIVLTAIGLSDGHAVAEQINASHVGLATMIHVKAAQTNRMWDAHQASKETLFPGLASGSEARGTAVKGPSTIERIKKELNEHEKRLMPGVVDAENIKAGFGQVHAPPETIEALKTLTSLSLLRPDAFRYGILAADRLPGLMLYGPPGTGKTLLAKAVAKESGATVLEISGAQIYEKYVGEGEKMVRAVFSLAKKLSPCIVFIDEADAIFGSRSNAGNRNTHREIINQFLREWDGMDMHNVFIMVASNRPFELDDAVLRRLPRRLLVDLPVAKDRESILQIHLDGEIVDETVDLSKLALDTPLYSGSDLKNLCVSAALACVREENELAESKKADKEFKLPEKRTLSHRHFEKAVKEISASISEDMGSLTAIRKFDEQYGERRNRRKKTAYGFGVGEVGVDEDAARVRQSSPGASSPPPSSSSSSSSPSSSPSPSPSPQQENSAHPTR